MDALDDLLSNVGTVMTSTSNNNKAANEVTLNYCSDIVLTNTNGSEKYILGTNQLYPIYDMSFINGAVHNVQMYLYTAVKWRDMFYTDFGPAILPEDDPEALLGYGCGVDIFDYAGGSPCIANSIRNRDLTIDEWCQLTHMALPAESKFVLPTVWRKADGGHKFWTPDEGIISALPVNIPMILESSEDFRSTIEYRLSSNCLASKVRSMLYMYMREHSIDRLYVGYTADLLKEPETQLINAYEWSKTHRRRVGEMMYNPDNFFGQIGNSKLRQLSVAINNGTFLQERLFV